MAPEPDTPEVVEVEAAATYDLRRRVLRVAGVDPEVALPEDEVPGSFHLGVQVGGRIVAIATCSPAPMPVPWPAAAPWRLRGMAVDPACQGRGLGRLLLTALEAQLRARGADVAWADGRDTALGFYRGAGWSVVGEGYVTSIGIPHHLVVRELRRPGPPSG